jgi:hypothetical protein
MERAIPAAALLMVPQARVLNLSLLSPRFQQSSYQDGTNVVLPHPASTHGHLNFGGGGCSWMAGCGNKGGGNFNEAK